MQDRARN